MGYYSDVTIVLEKNDFNRLLSEIKDNVSARNFLEDATLLQKGDLISMNWDSVKLVVRDCDEMENYEVPLSQKEKREIYKKADETFGGIEEVFDEGRENYESEKPSKNIEIEL